MRPATHPACRTNCAAGIFMLFRYQIQIPSKPRHSRTGTLIFRSAFEEAV